MNTSYYSKQKIQKLPIYPRYLPSTSFSHITSDCFLRDCHLRRVKNFRYNGLHSHIRLSLPEVPNILQLVEFGSRTKCWKTGRRTKRFSDTPYTSGTINLGRGLSRTVKYLLGFTCKEYWYDFKGEVLLGVEVMVLYVGYTTVLLSDGDVVTLGKRCTLLHGREDR